MTFSQYPHWTMNGRIHQCFILTLLYLNIISSQLNTEILYYEYGAHVDGEQVSYIFTGIVPAFTPNYNLNVTPHRPGMELRFTYLRAEYVNILSKVTVGFNPSTFALNFHVKFPFIHMPIGVVGYSMPNVFIYG